MFCSVERKEIRKGQLFTYIELTVFVHFIWTEAHSTFCLIIHFSDNYDKCIYDSHICIVDTA